VQRATQKFGSISGIQDESVSHDNLNRITGLSPKLAMDNPRLTSREDANLLLFLQENEEHGVYLHDMGQMDDTERSNLIIDKDTSIVYDMRREMDMARLERQTSGNLAADATDARLAAAQTTPRKSTKPKAKPWANLWKEKRQNNQDFMLAAEEGNMQEMLDLIDPAKKMLQVADVNTKGADNWTAMHYAANEGHGDILEALIEKNVDIEAVTN